jgi:tetratricopeptide (TPR) repeat protein
MKYSLLIGCTVALVSFAHPAAAKTSDEIQKIARSTTVEIKLQQNRSVGSGVIIHQQGDLYTLVTNLHVVCGHGRCSTLPEEEVYSLGLADGQKYQVKANNIRILDDDLDLAIIQFRSSRKYSIAQVAPESLKSDDIVYTAGFPLERSGFSFNKGEALVSLNKRFAGDKGGYSMIYNANTLPGMSGGGVFNSNGQLVAIHGLGDRYSSSTVTQIGKMWLEETTWNTKTGFNRGVPVEYLVKSVRKIGINLEQQKVSSEIITIRNENLESAEEHFITGFNKFFDSNNEIDDINQTIKEFSTAIKINPKYANAYLMRANAYSKLYNPMYRYYRTSKENKDLLLLAIKDCDRAIVINPNFAWAYITRGKIRYDLNEYTLTAGNSNPNDYFSFTGDINDYKKAIAIDPKFMMAYMSLAESYDRNNNLSAAINIYNQAININSTYHYFYILRGGLKQRLGDDVGAIADMNQAISRQPNSSFYYYVRGMTKVMLKDDAGAIKDLRQSAQIIRELNLNHPALSSIDYVIQQLGLRK